MTITHEKLADISLPLKCSFISIRHKFTLVITISVLVIREQEQYGFSYMHCQEGEGYLPDKKV